MAYTTSIRTAQNVIIEYEVATVWDRIVAFIIDSLIMISYIFFVSFIFGSIASNSDFSWFSGAMLVVLFLPIMFYSLLFEIFNNGQSPGKLVMNTQVVSLSGDPVTIGQYFLRWLFRLIDFHFFSTIVAVIVVAVSEKGQRIGDHVAGTTVISKKKKQNLDTTVFRKISENYKPKYSAAYNLNDNDIQIIQEVLANKSENRFTLLTKLAAKVEETLQLEKSESSETFLKIIVKDYNYFHSQD
jgi:uncharacterized RDD family membrane protein YckC